MADTQWPRYQVFVQENLGKPHLDAGSVHAPDDELALLNARDVFVRRPECVSLWVVRADRIFSRTHEELIQEASGQAKGENSLAGASQSYAVFCKEKPAGTHAYLCEAQATSPARALAQAIALYQSGKGATRTPYAWWVIPVRWITKSEPQESESWFSPARDKPFRLSTDFRTVSAMREIQKK